MRGKKKKDGLENMSSVIAEKMTAVPLGKNGDETAPAVCVGSPDCGAEQEGQQKGSRSHSTGCQTGCQRHYSLSGLACQPVWVI